MIKLILFDIYGVLIQGGYPETCKALAKKYTRDWKELYAIFYTKYFNQAATKKITQQEAWEKAIKETKLEIRLSKLKELHFSLMRFNAEMAALAQSLALRYKVVLLSKNTREQLQEALAHFPRMNELGEVVNTWELNLPKAGKETIDYLCKKYKVKAEEMVYIEDQEINLVAAREMGVRTILFESNTQVRKEITEILDQKKYEIIGRDFNSPFFRNYIWAGSFAQYPKLLGIPVLNEGIVCQGNMMSYLADMGSWATCHRHLKQMALKDNTFVEQLIDTANELGEKFNVWTEKELFLADVQKKTPAQLISLLDKFIEQQRLLYAYGVALPILDFQGFSFVERNLRQFLQSKVKPREFQQYYTVFTEPSANSFSQEQDDALLRLMSTFYSNSLWREDVKNKSLEYCKERYPDFYAQLQAHTKKFCWVYYVYAGPAFREEQFYAFIQDYLNKGIDPESKLLQRKLKTEETIRLKKKYLGQLKPDDFNLTILHLAGKLVWGKPRRKDYQSKAYYHCETLLREIGRRLYVSLDQVRSMPPDILKRGLLGEEINTSIAQKIAKCHVCVPNNGSVKVLYGNEAEDFIHQEIAQEAEQNFSAVTEIRGTIACQGQARGEVHIINMASDMEKMKQGDILVSIATTPAIVPAMKKAAAIITDEGGLTCHAAIVSRELGIPCIVGTKFATKALKDGDSVEIDAVNGIIKKA